MMKRAITPNIAIADQPSTADLDDLKRDGYVAVVNLRHDGEPDQPMGTVAEGEQVLARGMQYLHYGVGGAPLDPARIASVCEFLDQHGSDPVLVHCRKGARAAAVVLCYFARKQAWKPDQALAKGRAMGLELDGGLRTLVEQFLNRPSEPASQL
jgi:uncharacterized protein (TIGR01244 family)